MIAMPVGAALVGAASGLHAATWGMYKDALYEGFSVRTFSRSILVGAAAAAAIEAMLHFNLATPTGCLMLFGLAYALERGLVEWHKSFIREEDQSKYFIPMAFAVGGRVVTNRALRRASGALYATAVVLVVLGVANLRVATSEPSMALVMLIGSVGGWISAFGGAWKDAPKEGFETLKFFRSPAIASVWALALSTMTGNWLVIVFGALGFTIATIETHKMFDDLHVRGKFAGKPVRYPHMLEERRRFVPAFGVVWAAVLSMLAVVLW